MFGTLLATLILGAFIAGTITVVRIILFSIEYIRNYVKEKLKQNNQNKVMIAETKDLFREKMEEAKGKGISIDELEDMCDEIPYVSAVYDADTDEVIDIEGIKPEKIERKLKSVLEQNEGFVLLEE